MILILLTISIVFLAYLHTFVGNRKKTLLNSQNANQRSNIINYLASNYDPLYFIGFGAGIPNDQLMDTYMELHKLDILWPDIDGTTNMIELGLITRSKN